VFGTNWLEVGRIAQLAAAAGTLVLACGTVLFAIRTHEVASKTEGVAEKTAGVAEKTHELAQQTKSLVEMTGDLVEASLREASATESLAVEAKTDRQLAYRPQLELTLYRHVGDDFTFQVRNTGPGAAFQVTCPSREVENVTRWTLLRLQNLRPGEEAVDHSMIWTKGMALYSPFEHVLGTSSVEIVTVVILCSDVIGRRFALVRRGRSTSTQLMNPCEHCRRKSPMALYMGIGRLSRSYGGDGPHCDGTERRLRRRA
jgi:hypothetical protein